MRNTIKKSPKIGALVGNTLRPGALGRWGDRLISEEGLVETTTTYKSHNKLETYLCFSSSLLIYISSSCAHECQTRDFSMFVV